MPERISPIWKKLLTTTLDEGGSVDRTISYNPAAKWLIVQLSERGVPFKVYNLGGGVKRITTNTEVCPLCKKGV